MKFAGLSGGIGAGKSTVGACLSALGAAVLDVDRISRELQEPGMPFFIQIVERWGDVVLDADGRLDRAALAEIVFNDREELGALTQMAAPLNEQAIVDQASVHLGTDTVVIVEAALYLRPMYGMTSMIVVDVTVETAVARLVSSRGMTEIDARARIASQHPRELRLEHADLVIDNSGDSLSLDENVAAAWEWILDLPDAIPVLPTRD